MNTKLLTITRRGLAAGLLTGALALGTGAAASATVRVPMPCPGGTCGGHYGQVAHVNASPGHLRAPMPCPGGTCGGRNNG